MGARLWHAPRMEVANVTAMPIKWELTNANGWARLTLLAKKMNATGEYPVGNYKVEATYDIYSNSTTINMTDNQIITLRLSGLVIPEFPSFLILTLLMIATLSAIITHRKARAKEMSGQRLR